MMTQQIQHRYCHLDEFDDLEYDAVSSEQLHLYVFDSENRHNELEQTVSGLREQFIFAVGIVYPDWLEGDIEQLDSCVLNGIEFSAALGEEITESMVAKLQTRYGGEEA